MGPRPEEIERRKRALKRIRKALKGRPLSFSAAVKRYMPGGLKVKMTNTRLELLARRLEDAKPTPTPETSP